jgi:hypothetical protein
MSVSLTHPLQPVLRAPLAGPVGAAVGWIPGDVLRDENNQPITDDSGSYILQEDDDA